MILIAGLIRVYVNGNVKKLKQKIMALVKKVKKAQKGLSLLAKYAGKTTAKNLGKSLDDATRKKLFEKGKENMLPYDLRPKKLDPFFERTIPQIMSSARKDFQRATTPSAQKPISTVPKSAETVKKKIRHSYEGLESGGKMTKAKKGGSFPDLNKDGKITKADILKGRGVIAKKGAKVSKAKSGAKKMMGGGKCKYGC
jgi:hypothetical protein